MATLKNQKFTWDKDDLTPKCRAVLDLLNSLVEQFKYLMEESPTAQTKGKSRPCAKAIDKVRESLNMFDDIVTNVVIPSAEKKPSLSNLKHEIQLTLDDVQTLGKEFIAKATVFSTDPLDITKRQEMIESSRKLMRYVTKLLILADFVDVANMLELLKDVEAEFYRTRKCENLPDFQRAVKELGAKTGELFIRTGQREADLLPEHQAVQEEMGAARQELRDSGIRLITTSKAYFVDPAMNSAADNRDAAIKAFQNNLKRIKNAIMMIEPKNTDEIAIQTETDERLKVADELNNFDALLPDPIEFDEAYHKQSLTNRLEDIIGNSAFVADLETTAPDRRDRIVESCQSLRAALGNLLDEYMSGAKSGNQQNINDAIDALIAKNRQLTGHLHRAAGDQVGEVFLNPLVPFLFLYNAAKEGQVDEVKAATPTFNEHAENMVDSAKLIASMLTDRPDLRAALLRSAADLDDLRKPVTNSAFMLSTKPDNVEYGNNMEIMKTEWETKLKALTDNVDQSVDVIDFLAMSQQQILKDIGQCIQAAQDKNANDLDKSAAFITGRVERVHDVVKADMRCYESDYFVDRANELADQLKNDNLEEFTKTATKIVESLQQGEEIESEELIHASTIVFTGVQDVFKAVLETRSPEEYAHLNLNVIVQDQEKPMSSVSDMTVDTGVSGDLDESVTQKAVFQKRTEEERIEIQQNLEEFKATNEQAERELEKWDDSQNDMIALARKMTQIMHQMTEYTRGEGQLKTNKDVIRAAAKLSHYGKKLSSLAVPIADECTDKRLSQQLMEHVAKIDPLQHQLKVLARVKQEVEQVAGELVVSGLDSVTSLIQNARNLLVAVLDTVRSAHTCSIRMEAAPLVWNPKMPGKKPLVNSQQQQRRKIIRRDTNKYERSENQLKTFIGEL